MENPAFFMHKKIPQSETDWGIQINSSTPIVCCPKSGLNIYICLYRAV